MIALQQDRRAMRQGYATIYVNPAEVSAVVCNENRFDEDNQSIVILNNGTKIPVQDYPSAVIKILNGGAK